MNNGDKLAFPIEINGFGQYAPEVHGGMTKREMIAMHSMQGLISGLYADGTNFTSNCPAVLAKSSVIIADALLNELDAQNER